MVKGHLTVVVEMGIFMFFVSFNRATLYKYFVLKRCDIVYVCMFIAYVQPNRQTKLDQTFMGLLKKLGIPLRRGAPWEANLAGQSYTALLLYTDRLCSCILERLCF